MKIIFRALILILIASFQGSISNPIEAGGIRPDLVLITVYYLGVLRGDVMGGLTGAMLGFFLDVTSAGPVYSNIFIKTFIGYLAGVIGRWVHNPGYILHMVLIFLVSLIQGLIMTLIFLFLGTSQLTVDIFYITFPQAVFDGVIGGIIYWLVSLAGKMPLQAIKS